MSKINTLVKLTPFDAETAVFDLTKYADTGDQYFTSRSLGSHISRRERIDNCVNSNKKAVLVFPSSLCGINSVFLEDLLEQTVKQLGNKPFDECVEIRNKSLYNVEALVKEAIQSLRQRKFNLAY